MQLTQAVYIDFVACGKMSIFNFVNVTERMGDLSIEHLFQLHRKQLTPFSTSHRQLLDMARSVLNPQFYVITDAQWDVVVYCHFGPAADAVSSSTLLTIVDLCLFGNNQ